MAESTIAAPDAPKAPEVRASLTKTFQTIWGIKSFRYLIYGSALVAFAIFGFQLWMVDFIFRTHGLTIDKLTVPLALGLGVGGGIGTVAAAFFIALPVSAAVFPAID